MKCLHSLRYWALYFLCSNTESRKYSSSFQSRSFFVIFPPWVNSVSMPYSVKPPVIQTLAVVAMHYTSSWELLVLDILIGFRFAGLTLTYRCISFLKSIRKTPCWTCTTIPVSVVMLPCWLWVKLFEVNFELIVFRHTWRLFIENVWWLTQSRANKDVLYPSLSLNFTTSWGIVMHEDHVFRQNLTVVACAFIYHHQ